jgi:hypothetical protein
VTCVKPFEIDLAHPVMITEGTVHQAARFKTS